MSGKALQWRQLCGRKVASGVGSRRGVGLRRVICMIEQEHQSRLDCRHRRGPREDEEALGCRGSRAWQRLGSALVQKDNKEDVKAWRFIS
jgi:hypothetical protein